MMDQTTEAAILDAIQQDFPLTHRPFETIGAELGVTEAQVVEAVRELDERDLIREISAILDGRHLGFHSSLVAARVAPEALESVAAAVSADPRVSHNYERAHEYNLWFTVAAPDGKTIEEAVRELVGDRVEANNVLLLPAVQTYKLRVKLPAAGLGVEAARRGPRRHTVSAQPHGHAAMLTDADRMLLAILERPLPIVPDVWAEIGRRAGVAESRILDSVERWKREGVIRRVSAVLRHRNLGYTANGMGCYALSKAEADAAGPKVAARDFVSHCYYRDAGGRWPYPFFAMIHAKRTDECLERALSIACDTDARDYLVLFSKREFKKERVRYFQGVD